jgi:hypothetical protein
VFLHDAADLVAARQKGVLIHHTRDIDAAGDEVEIAARDVLKRRLARGYYVGHGHIVDSRLVTSPQLDVIVADNSNTPVLFRTENNTEYTPYESVYAVGEVKSCYYKSKKYIEGFSTVLRRIKTELQREKVSANYVGGGIELGTGLTTGIRVPYRNPMFSFLLFVDAGDFALGDVLEHYRKTPVDELPNVVCFLNRAVLFNGRVRRKDGRQHFSGVTVQPEFGPPETPDEINRWVFLSLGNAETCPAYSLAFLYFALTGHLATCMLKPPNMGIYLNSIFTGTPKEGQILE